MGVTFIVIPCHACYSPSDAVTHASLLNFDPFFGLSLHCQHKALVLTFKATDVSCLGYSRDSVSVSVGLQRSFDHQKSKANRSAIITRKKTFSIESIHCIVKCHIPAPGEMAWTLQDREQKWMYHFEHTAYHLFFSTTGICFPMRTFFLLSSVEMAGGLHSRENTIHLLLIPSWERTKWK